MSDLTKESLIKVLDDNDGSYFASLLSDNIINKLFMREYTLFVPTNSFFEYLTAKIPETNGGNRYISIETLLNNAAIKSTVPNHFFAGHLTNTRPQTVENIQVMSRLILKYRISWNRKQTIDKVPMMKLVKLGPRSRGKFLLHIYFIDGIFANEKQNEEIYSIKESDKK